MLHPHRNTIRNIALLFAHSAAVEDHGNRIYEVAAALISPESPAETFSSYVRYAGATERERHASGATREVLKNGPALADVTAYLSAGFSRADVVATLNPREAVEPLLSACGSPRVVDLRFAAEFFLPQADSSGLKSLWEHLQGKPRGKFSFTAAEALDLSIDLTRHIAGVVLNPAEFPPAGALRFYLEKSDTLFGKLFLHLNRNFRDYFGSLFDPSLGSDTPDWKGFLEKAPLPLPRSEETREKNKRISLARLPRLYEGLAAGAGYSLRPSQIDYARHVAAALNDGAVLTIEAGTGTGKTQGYLIPVMEYLRLNPGARVAVSTYTKNLQEQIVRREIPLTVSLDSAYGKIPAALLKGKSNYPCAEKLDRLYDDTLSGGRLLAWLAFVQRAFHFRRTDGDAVGERIRHHLNDGLFFRRLLHEISARSGCSPRHRRCPAQVVAAEALNARLIVTNHHKLALLNRDETLGGLFENCVIDEANHFEGAVRGAFAVEISSREISDTLAYLESVTRRLTPSPAFPATAITSALAAMDQFRGEAAGFSAALGAVRGGAAAPGEAALLPAEHPSYREGSLKIHLACLRKGLKGIAGAFAFVKRPDLCRELGLHSRTIDRLKTALGDLQENGETLKRIGETLLSPGHVTAAILFVRHWVVTVRAVEVADLLRDHLYGGRNAVIFTSATLRQGESFEGFRRTAGIPAGEAADSPQAAPSSSGMERGTGCGIMSPFPGLGSPPGDPPCSGSEAAGQEKSRTRSFRFEAVPSPFDPEAAEIIVPPEAISGAFEDKEAWLSRVAQLLPGLIRRNRGRTLVLFASYGDLESILSRVAGEIHGDGYPLLVQQAGASTAGLCEEFRAIRESVLFGVDTFWYGVDFPGETLTQVIITRLPYPHPQDPLQVARRNLLPREDYWRRYRYETAIKLRQGIGRLIRSEADRGRIVILDSRYRRPKKPGGEP